MPERWRRELGGKAFGRGGERSEVDALEGRVSGISSNGDGDLGLALEAMMIVRLQLHNCCQGSYRQHRLHPSLGRPRRCMFLGHLCLTW